MQRSAKLGTKRYVLGYEVLVAMDIGDWVVVTVTMVLAAVYFASIYAVVLSLEINHIIKEPITAIAIAYFFVLASFTMFVLTLVAGQTVADKVTIKGRAQQVTDAILEEGEKEEK